MSRAQGKPRKKGSIAAICQEKLACSNYKEPPTVKCSECGTFQCQNCDEELHREGDYFFHERVKLIVTQTETETAVNVNVNPQSKLNSSSNVSSESIAHLPGSVAHSHSEVTKPPTEQLRSLSSTGQREGRASESQSETQAGTGGQALSSKNLAHFGRTKVQSETKSRGQTTTEHCNNDDQPVTLKKSVIGLGLAEKQFKQSHDFHEKRQTSPTVDHITLADPSSDSDFSSGEFCSLGLDSILSSELDSLDMKGQPKSSKKAKNKKSTTVSSKILQPGTTTIDEAVGVPAQDIHIGEDLELDIDTSRDYFTTAYGNSNINYSKYSRTPPIDSPQSDEGDEDLISDLIQSVSIATTGFGNESTSSNSHHHQNGFSTEHAKRADVTESCHATTARQRPTGMQSFLLINESEDIQLDKDADFLHRLGCGDVNVKVVSIFGNTGDGKSFTLNQVFFGGEEVFATSADQDTCTVGVWAAYDMDTKVICVDTEGLLGVTNNQNKRTRLLLKVLAVSDVIIYRTSADRLHTDMFQFLGDASLAYSKHFKVELESLKPMNGCRLQDLGPAVIVFHETTRTNTLDASASGKSANEILRERFAKLDCDLSSFSSIHYVGVKTSQSPTDFKPLISRVRKEVENCSVRSPRSPIIILEMLKVLNTKFKGEIYSHSPNSFPDEFFTCVAKCLACHSRCSQSMNHKTSHQHLADCRYVHVYDNKVYICKRCFQKGRKNVVVPKTCASDDNSVMGVAKYAWAGYILECNDCGVIYKSRQHWYGNRDPTETEVQIEIRHIWPGQAAMPTGTHNAARKLLDGVKVVADTVSSYSGRHAKMLSDWAADQVAPPYWVPNIAVVECHTCNRAFDEQEKKHHCRACGQGFCDECTQYTRPVPERGWGPSPVRVCEQCYDSPTGNTAIVATPGGDSNSLLPRQIIENVQSVLGAVTSVAIDYPMEVIKDSARPAYWVPDHLIKDCHQCHAEFGPKLTIHHCRACGNGVCHGCSDNRRQVPSKGWDTYVRVCDTCYAKEGAL